MKKGWERKKLGDLYRVGSSKRVLKSQWKTSGVPFYRGREVTRLATDGFVDNELFISEDHFTELSKVYGVPKAGDIVITAIGTIGNSHVVRDSDRFYFKDASVLWMKRTAEVSSEFVNLWLKSPLFFDQLDRGNGATVDTLTIQKLDSVQISIPSLSEQQRIVGVLDEAFEGLATAKANAEKNLQNSRALFESHLQSVLRNKKWKWKTLGELCDDVEYGSSAKSKADGGVPVLRMGNIQDGRLDWENLVYTDDTAEIKKYLLKHNDVLFNRTNSPELVGKTAIYKSEMPAIFAGYLIRIHRKEDLLDGDFLTYFLNSQIAFDYGKTVVISSVNQANINGTKLKSYPIPAPSLSEQKTIVAKLNKLSEETQRLATIYEQKLAALEALEKSLLHQAFSGDL
jgi:type I restriction enzyme S subunit